MEAQHTNLDRVAASPTAPNFSMEFLEFLFFKQNLPREITVDQSGTGLVKGNSTYTRILYPKGLPMMDFLILSLLFLHPTTWPTQVYPMSEDQFQTAQGASGILICLPSME